MKKKIKHLLGPFRSINSQYHGSFLGKMIFMLSIFLHYGFKFIGLSGFIKIPKATFKYSGNNYMTRKDTIDFMILRENEEPDLTHFLNKIEEPCVFFDVGAHIGRYTILMTEKGHEVYSFEPIKSNYESTLYNLKLNALEGKATVHNIGLSNEKAQKPIYMQNHKSGEASLEQLDGDDVYEMIETDTLDNLYKSKYNKLCVVKIDVEGHEFAALEGMVQFIKTNHPIIVLELWSGNKEKVNKLLRDLGYKNLHIFWFHDPDHDKYKDMMYNMYNKHTLQYPYQ